MERIEGQYKADASQIDGESCPIVKSDVRTVCRVTDGNLATAELIASALNLWELGSADDDNLDQLTAAHQMNLALSKQCKQLQEQIEALKNRLPAGDEDDYGDNLIETGQALLSKAGKGGSYDLSTFDSARISAVDVSRIREQFRGEDAVIVRASIEMRKSCIKSGEYDGQQRTGNIGDSMSFGGMFRP